MDGLDFRLMNLHIFWEETLSHKTVFKGLLYSYWIYWESNIFNTEDDR